jgi:hypothetical protein
MRHFALAVSAAVLVAGCTPDRPKLPTLPAAFATIPLPPDPEFLGQSGSEDALMFTFRSIHPADTVAAHYNALFAADTGYKLKNTIIGASGEHAYYVEYHRRPMWVRIRPEAGSDGSVIELTGAVVSASDTTTVIAPPDLDTMPNGTSISPRSAAPQRRPPR